MAGAGATASSSVKVLLLLDLNGTLCYRGDRSVRGVRADLRFKQKYWYGRAGRDKLLRELSATGYYHVCVYTSMMTHNAAEGVNAIFSREERHLIQGIFDREYNKRDPQGPKKWDTVRDVRKIWNSFGATTTPHSFDATNTILIDSEARKLKHAPRNGIVIPPYGPEQVSAGNDDALERLASYLVRLARDAPTDVRHYLREHPCFLPRNGTDTLVGDLALDFGRIAVSPRNATDPLLADLTANFGRIAVHENRGNNYYNNTTRSRRRTARPSGSGARPSSTGESWKRPAPHLAQSPVSVLGPEKITSSSKEKEDDCCVICLETIRTAQQAVRLPCMHVFHPNCVLPYLRRLDSPKCPTCRSSVPHTALSGLPVWTVRKTPTSTYHH